MWIELLIGSACIIIFRDRPINIQPVGLMRQLTTSRGVGLLLVVDVDCFIICTTSVPLFFGMLILYFFLVWLILINEMEGGLDISSSHLAELIWINFRMHRVLSLFLKELGFRSHSLSDDRFLSIINQLHRGREHVSVVNGIESVDLYRPHFAIPVFADRPCLLYGVKIRQFLARGRGPQLLFENVLRLSEDQWRFGNHKTPSSVIR